MTTHFVFKSVAAGTLIGVVGWWALPVSRVVEHGLHRLGLGSTTASAIVLVLWVTGWVRAMRHILPLLRRSASNRDG